MQILLISSCLELTAWWKLCSPGFPVGRPLTNWGQRTEPDNKCLDMSLMSSAIILDSRTVETKDHSHSPCCSGPPAPLLLVRAPTPDTAPSRASSAMWSARSKLSTHPADKQTIPPSLPPSLPPFLSFSQISFASLRPSWRIQFMKEMRNNNHLSSKINNFVFTGIILGFGNYR